MNEITWLSHGGPGSGEFPDKLMLSKREIVRAGLLKHIREMEMKIARDIPSSCERRRIW